VVSLAGVAAWALKAAATSRAEAISFMVIPFKVIR
jgi:hypothetical protein